MIASTRLYQNSHSKWAGDAPCLTPKLVRGWFKCERKAGFQHPKTIQAADEHVLAIESIWRDGRIPLVGGGMAIMCNECASAASRVGIPGHAVVLAYTQSEVWIFNSQIFQISPHRDSNTDKPVRALAFSGIQLVGEIMTYDTRATERPWYHVPNGDDPCLETALSTVIGLAMNGPRQWAATCVQAARNKVLSLEGDERLKFQVEDQRVYQLRL